MAAAATARATWFNPDLEPAEMQVVPQPAQAYPPFDPRPLPAPWIAAQNTAGNNVVAAWGKAAKTVHGDPSPQGLVFDPATGTSQAAAVNAFFLCNYLHDFFYLLGFGESAGALQRTNPAGVGGGNDALEVRVVSFVGGDAKAETHADGHRVRLFLGPITGPDLVVRHTAFDAEVVIKKYTHAVTSRRVGGVGLWKPLLHGPPQAQAMEEGMSDYFALTLQNHLRRRAGLPANWVYGAWSSSNPTIGRRPASYATFVGPFDRLGTGGFTDSHAAGMVWCAALLAMNRRFATVLGSTDRGDLAGWLLAYEAMPLIPVGHHAPGFLDGRDALVRTATSWQTAIPALADGPLATSAQAADLERAVREAFAEIGMGRSARSHAGGFTGIVNDFQA